MNEALQSNPGKSVQTRRKVIEAAIACIDSEGFHAAHTNRIVATAGVSWGVIQYQFGSKAGLLEAVLESIFDDFKQQLEQAPLIDGDLRERIGGFTELLWTLVSKPAYRVSLDILRNAGAEESALDGQGLLANWSRDIADLWRRSFPLNSNNKSSQQQHDIARRLLFATLRGLADELTPVQEPEQLQAEFDALIDALATLLAPHTRLG